MPISIHQFSSGSAVADAITNCLFFVQSLLRGFGFASEVFAQHVDPLLATRIRPIETLQIGRDDVLLIHHSIGHDIFDRLQSIRCRKVLVYHNITPPRFFQEGDPTRDYIVKGYAQISLFRDIVETAIAVSEVNAAQLRQRGFAEVTVIPLLKDFAAIRHAAHAKQPYYDRTGVFRLLFVGRIIPHKCQHELIDFAGNVSVIGDVPLELVLVGLFEGDSYKRQLDARIARLHLAERVRLTGRVSDADLYGWYRAADAFVSLSEHEGFGVPLLEAMTLDLPVLAYAEPGVAETLGDAGIVLADKQPASILGPLLRLAEDRRFRSELIRRQRRRVLDFSRERIEQGLRQWLANAGIMAVAAAEPEPAPPAPRTRYVVEGPFETSYSLASVNRNIALALARREGCAAHIEPAEGTEDYAVDADAAAALPAAVRDLVQPAPLSDGTIVTIRNTYPPRPNGMLGDRRLLHLAWEEGAIAPDLADLMNTHLDGAIVPAEYCRRVLRNSGVRLPIAVVGHGVDHLGRLPPPAPDRSSQPVSSATPYTFLHISSGSARKGIEELLTAYCMAFSSRDPVLLVIKTYDNPDNVIDASVERLVRRLPLAPAIQVIWDDLQAPEMDILYGLADAVVLPARGEGFNLPAAEAMARGRPVIATRHSGHLDFCNDGNSRLVDFAYEMSQSHLRVPNSVWARAAIGDLVNAMRTLYQDGRGADSSARARARQACRDVSRLRWHDVARRIDDFVRHLDNRPVMNRKLRLGWISTYNARCGIAAYSQHLIEHFDRNTFDITILADDQEPLGPDPENLQRLWRHKRDSLATLTDHLLRNRYDIAFFQHHYGFFEFEPFANLLSALHRAGIATYVTFHRTYDDSDADPNGAASLQRIAAALATCTRLFVHGVEDMNRLKQYGLTDNVVLVPHGVVDRPALDSVATRQLLGLQGFDPIIGTFGFLLPGKGLPALIHGFALLLRHYPEAFLLMLDADYPDPVSRQERERCLALIGQLGLDDRIRLVNDFLEVEEINFLLSACDAIVYPYDGSKESDSGAVRLGLAAGRPVATTPLPVFSGLAGIVYRLPGSTAAEIADGLAALLGDEALKDEVVERQRDWVRANSWARQAGRIGNLMRGCFEEAHGSELRPPAGMPAAAPSRAAAPGSWREEEMQVAAALLRRGPQPAGPGNGAMPQSAPPIDDLPPLPAAATTAPQRAAARGAWLRRLTGKRGGSRQLVLANRARDSRQWVAAAGFYRSVLDDNPENPPIWVQYGHSLKESGRLAEAEEAYRQSIALAPQIADTHLQLGHVLKLQDRPTEAAAAYMHALALDPALDHAALELFQFGWNRERIERFLRRERGRIAAAQQTLASAPR